MRAFSLIALVSMLTVVASAAAVSAAGAVRVYAPREGTPAVLLQDSSSSAILPGSLATALPAFASPALPDVTAVAASDFKCFASDAEAKVGNPTMDCGALIRAAATHFTRCPAIDRVKLAQCKVVTESSKIFRKVGSAGEISWVQIKPRTFSDMRIAYPWLGLSDVWDPYDNIASGMAYDDYLMGRDYIGCSVDNVIHAYNVGQGAFRAGKRNAAYHKDVAGCYNA